MGFVKPRRRHISAFFHNLPRPEQGKFMSEKTPAAAITSAFGARSTGLEELLAV
jgi:hypothetical protein